MEWMQRFFYLFIIFVFASSSAFSQKLKGTVVDDSGAPVLYANVVWLGTSQGTTTDEEGTFAIEKPKELPALLVVSCIGYATDTLKVWPNMKKVTLTLKSTVNLNEVEIQARQKATTVSTLTTGQLETLGEKELNKGACCTVSESFETNASVDVNVTDAVSGTKKIRMLGLDGVYTQIQLENLPLVRGGSAAHGLNYIPGTWVESIQIKKGAGSVVNGYESITGQINIEVQKPDEAPKWYFNAYGNAMGRMEANVQAARKLNNKWSSALFLHGAAVQIENDRNNDGFLDTPLRKTVNVMNRWKYSHKDVRAQLFVRLFHEEANSGQVSSIQNRYEVNAHTDQLYVFTKTGFIMDNENSVAVLLKGKYHHHRANFGLTQYDVKFSNFNVNVMYNDQLKDDKSILKLGLNANFDNYMQLFNDSNMNTNENVIGGYTEYAYQGKKVQVVGGLRGDYHNTFGFFATPRLHMKYSGNERSALRVSAGRGQRTPYVLIENSQYLISSRQVQFQNDFQPEVAWNYGASFTQNFNVKSWEMGLSADYYYTNFENQTVIDVENPRAVTYYNLEGQSFSHAVQGELSATYNRFDIKGAYKFLDVQTQYRSGLKQVPYIPKQRVLLNTAYATRFDKWKIDFTALWSGISRVPSTEDNPEPLQRSTSSSDFWTFNMQINRKFRLFEVYVGAENLLDYRQQNPIIDSENPFGDYFDASMVWGPVFGRNIYAGFKMKLN